MSQCLHQHHIRPRLLSRQYMMKHFLEKRGQSSHTSREYPHFKQNHRPTLTDVQYCRGMVFSENVINIVLSMISASKYILKGFFKSHYKWSSDEFS